LGSGGGFLTGFPNLLGREKKKRRSKDLPGEEMGHTQEKTEKFRAIGVSGVASSISRIRKEKGKERGKFCRVIE